MAKLLRLRHLYHLRRLHISAAILCFAALAAVHNMAVADDSDTALVNLIALVSQRLELAEPTAHWKWDHQQPITDAPREAALLTEAEKRARVAQVDPTLARQFFQDQINASKQVQHALFDSWRATHPPSGAPVDLATQIRPQFDRLTPLMIAGLARIEPVRQMPDCPIRLARSVENWKAMNRYSAMIDAKVLATALAHVCLTGGIARTS